MTVSMFLVNSLLLHELIRTMDLLLILMEGKRLFCTLGLVVMKLAAG